ncbi:terminase small subunit [Serratia fonticola]|uniref:terminase small subunit n=1 Tax=Serratia fonticola TaxID=47917 RepID=UPI00301DECD4
MRRPRKTNGEPNKKRFVAEYLKDSNATQAAARAGYSEKIAYSIGEENLRKPEIAQPASECIGFLTNPNGYGGLVGLCGVEGLFRCATVRG